jgi:hypothetical protein
VWGVLALVLLFSVVVRLRLIEVPLERDEGEYAYMAQLILDGVPPYTQAFNMKLPGIYAAYAVILAVFGQTQSGIHLGLLLVNVVTTVLVFLLARTWLRNPGALAAAAAFALLSLGQSLQGVFANAEHFVLPFAVSGLLAIRRFRGPAVRWPSLLFAGSLLGVGVVMKQHGALFAAYGVILAWVVGTTWRERLRSASGVAAGVLLPYALTCAVFAVSGTFAAFWFWTVRYASAYSSQLPLEALVPNFAISFQPIVRESPLLWLLAALGLVGVWIVPRLRASAPAILTFAVFSFLAIAPGYFFRPHYFVLTLPAVAILVGAAIDAAETLLERRFSVKLARAAALGILVLASGQALARQGEFLFRMTPHQASRDTYGANPFPESIEIARYIRENSVPADRIAVLGSEPQIFFYADRRSVTGHIYAYALMELHDYALEMQREVIADIERDPPKFLVFVRITTSWLQRPGSHTEIFQWFSQYSERNYRVVGLVELGAGGEARYRWGAGIPWPPQSRQWVAVMERR